MRQRGLAAYLQLSAAELLRYRCQNYGYHRDEAVEYRAMLVAIANGRQYGNRLLIAPGARLDDGLLEVVVVEQLSLLVHCVASAVAVSRHSAARWRGHDACGQGSMG